MDAAKSTYRVIDTSTWKRKLHCHIFKDAIQPQYNVCLELDITNFLQKVREKNWSFSLAFIHTVSQCASGIEEFRYRFLNEDVVLYDTIHKSFTYLNTEKELFKVVNVPMQPSIEGYMEMARETIENQIEYIIGPIANDVYQFSSLPWVAFTHFSHTLIDKSRKSNPMFDWGKYHEKNGRMVIPFSVQVHHSFVDGFHVGKLVQQLQERLNSF